MLGPPGAPYKPQRPLELPFQVSLPKLVNARNLNLCVLREHTFGISTRSPFDTSPCPSLSLQDSPKSHNYL